MKDKELKQNEYKTKLDKFIGETFQKVYNKIGIAGSIFFGLIFLIVSIIFFIRLISNNYFSKFNFDLSDKNEVGDALGGLTAPFIGITGVTLTFLAFWVQYQFNRNQFRIYKKANIERKLDEYDRMVDMIINDTPKFNVESSIALNKIVDMLLDEYESSKETYFDDFTMEDKLADLAMTAITSRFTDIDTDTRNNYFKQFPAIWLLTNRLFTFFTFLDSDIKKYNLSDAEIEEIYDNFYKKFRILKIQYFTKIFALGFTYFDKMDNKYLISVLSQNDDNVKIMEFLQDYFNHQNDEL